MVEWIVWEVSAVNKGMPLKVCKKLHIEEFNPILIEIEPYQTFNLWQILKKMTYTDHWYQFIYQNDTSRAAKGFISTVSCQMLKAILLKEKDAEAYNIWQRKILQSILFKKFHYKKRDQLEI